MKLGLALLVAVVAGCSPQAQQLEAKVARVVYTDAGRACVLLGAVPSEEAAAVLCESADDLLGVALDSWQARLQRLLAEAKDAGADALATGYTR